MQAKSSGNHPTKGLSKPALQPSISKRIVLTVRTSAVLFVRSRRLLTAAPLASLNLDRFLHRCCIVVVTETDQAVEKLIKDEISNRYSDHAFIGEESFAGGERVDLTDAPTWIVDPIGEFLR